MNLLISTVYAQAGNTAAQVSNEPAWMGFLPFVVLFMIFYFLLIRPQKKRMEKEQDFIKSIERGQEVYTKSGVIGKITGMTPQVVTLEISEAVRMKVLRSQIGGLLKDITQPTQAKVGSKKETARA